MNGDGVPDLAVGAQGDDDGGSARGAVYVLFLDASGSVLAEQKISDTVGGLATGITDGSQFGSALASTGDLDGDAGPGLVVGARYDDDGGSNAGSVYVVEAHDGDAHGQLDRRRRRLLAR